MTDPRGSECGCALCGQMFSCLALFNAHQDVDYTRAPVIICRSPEAMRVDERSHPLPARGVGLGLAQDARGTWCTPAGLKARERATRLLARATSERQARFRGQSGG